MMDWASLVLRVGLGIMFFAHGLQMAFGKLGGSGVQGFSKMLSGLGMAPALFWSYVAAYSVLIGGAFLILGILTRISCIALIIFMGVAILKVHITKGFFITNGGYEYNFIVIFALLALILLGAGKFSIYNKF